MLPNSVFPAAGWGVLLAGFLGRLHPGPRNKSIPAGMPGKQLRQPQPDHMPPGEEGRKRGYLVSAKLLRDIRNLTLLRPSQV